MVLVIVSSELFTGFKLVLDDTIAELSLSEQSQVVNTEAKKQLIQEFTHLGLMILVDKARAMQLHLHGPLSIDKDNYACDHCH